MAAVWTRVVFAPSQWTKQAIRPLSVGVMLSSKASTKSSSPLDPVQQLFLDKLKEYKTKSSGAHQLEFVHNIAVLSKHSSIENLP